MWKPALLTLLLASPAWATVAPLSIDEDATWTLADSPIEVEASCRVYEGATLTIEPGVQVWMHPDASLRISGELIARGTADAPIVFTSAPGDEFAPWLSVLFEDSSVDATFEAVDDYVAGSIVEHCTFEHATRALDLDGASPYITSNTFVDNDCDCDDTQVGGAALHIGPDSAPRVRGNRFENNSVGTIAWGGAVYAHSAAPILQGNTFVGNSGPYGGALCTSSHYAPIVGNTFTDNTTNWEGGGVSLYSSSPAFFDNTLTGNTGVLDGAAIHVCIDCFPHATPLMMDNVVVDNILSSEFGAAGVGAAYMRVFRDNDLHGNLAADQPSDFGWFNEWLDLYRPWVTAPDISRNWWGTTDAAAIERAIHDGADEEGLGVVTWDPPRDAPAAASRTRVGVTTTRLHYHQEGLEMPLYVTLYNPGAERAADLLLLVQVGDAAPMPWLGALDFPGAERRGDLLRLTLPEDSVWFGVPLEPGYAPADASLDHLTWHAVLLDPDTGAALDSAVSARVDLFDDQGVQR